MGFIDVGVIHCADELLVNDRVLLDFNAGAVA